MCSKHKRFLFLFFKLSVNHRHYTCNLLLTMVMRTLIMHDEPCCRKDQYYYNHPHLRSYILNVIAADIDPHLIDPFAGICIKVLHDRTSLDRRFVRILGIELTSCLLLRSCYDVIRIRIITTEEITKRIFCCIFFSIFRT